MLFSRRSDAADKSLFPFRAPPLHEHISKTRQRRTREAHSPEHCRSAHTIATLTKV